MNSRGTVAFVPSVQAVNFVITVQVPFDLQTNPHYDTAVWLFISRKERGSGPLLAHFTDIELSTCPRLVDSVTHCWSGLKIIAVFECCRAALPDGKR